MNHEAPYRDVHQALSEAFAAESREIYSSNNFFAAMRKNVIHAASHLDQWERLAQAALTMLTVRQTLNQFEMDIVEAYYMIENRAMTKEGNCRTISYDLWEEMGKRPDRWYLCDVTREWARARRHHDDVWWANHTGKDTSTLYRWRNGTKTQAGAVQRLHIKLDNCVSKLSDPLQSFGIIKYAA